MGLNEFRICADFVHLFSFFILIRKIFVNQSCAGISGKTQILLSLVYTIRYLDLFLYFISFYNTIFKLTFIGLAFLTLYLIYFKFRNTYDEENDSFWMSLIIYPVFILALSVNYLVLNSEEWDFNGMLEMYTKNPLEITWTFSIYLEALAIIPQLHMMRKTGNGQIVASYITALAVYRGLYICNWIYRYLNENLEDYISSVSGSVETLLLLVALLYTQIRKHRKPKWQNMVEVFTIETSDIKKVHLPICNKNKSEDSDLSAVLPTKH